MVKRLEPWLYLPALAVSLSMLSLGALISHLRWLVDWGTLISLINCAVFVMPAIQKFGGPTVAERLQRMCTNAGLSFEPPKPMNWLVPSAAGTLFLAITFQVAAIILARRHSFLHSLSDAFAVALIVVMGVCLSRALKLNRVVGKLERVYHIGNLNTSPPKAARLAVLLIPKRHREHLIGDLDEEYWTVLLPEYGPTCARIWYWWQVAVSLGPFLWVQLQRAAIIAWLSRQLR
jgi:hypothetical protein